MCDHCDSTHAGHSCGCDHGHDHEANRSVSLSLIAAGALVGAALVLEWTGVGRLARWPAIAAMLAAGWPLLPGAWASVRRLRPDINLLVVIAAIGASVVGQWVEAGTVVFLFGVAEWLEGWADRRARHAIEALLEIAPKNASVRRAGVLVEAPVEEVEPGETVVVKSGMSIPLDGKVLVGESAVDQSPITGEALPVEKRPGDAVYAGTVNGSGMLELRVTMRAGDTTLARIVRLVKEAEEQKAPTERFVDVFARYYTPVVTVLALLVFAVPPLAFHEAWSVWLYRACVLLIIACPCALVISTPVSIVAGLTALARRGVLVKGGAHLESLARVRALAVDKTGTITVGRPAVQSVEALGSHSEEQVLRIAAAIDAHSSHPLAVALVRHAQSRGIEIPNLEKHRDIAGRGAEGEREGHAYFVGNHRFTHELGVCSAELERRLETIESRGHSVVLVGHKPHDACPGEVMGIIGVGDSMRGGAAEAVKALHRAGVEKVVMLSGDNARAVRFIAAQAGIDEATGDLLPEDKVAAVKALRASHGVVAMVGDGVNDAPAMATASVSIAMGEAGTDAAIETADVTLMKDDLGRIAEAVRLARRTLAIIRFNIGFALGLKALFLTLAIAGYTSLWLAILADTGATLLVVANALRLLRNEPHR